MPSIIPSYGSAPGPVNMTASEYIGSFTLASGTYRHATNLTWLWQDTSGSGLFTNNGTIWWMPTISTQWTFTVVNSYDFQNTGKIVVKTSEYNQDIEAIRFGHSLTNSGQIFAIASNGDVQVISTDNPLVTVTNSGLLAGQATNGLLQTVFMRYGGVLNNQVGGQILAEGSDAVAVLFRDARFNSQINNAGLIEANSTDPGVLSAAIYIGQLGLEGQTVQITNSGVIRGGYAIIADDNLASAQTQMSAEVVINQSGGLIEGVIALNRGNDRVENSGTIRGDIIMGEGDDVFITSGGTVEGVVDLGWGNDTFTGSAGVDRVGGDDGNDTLTGNGGNDILFGGGNNDTLTGGGGNDGLYGEYGNDRIVTQAGDIAEGGAGNDRIELGDYSFARADGGDGFDTLVLAPGARKLDLSAALSTGRIANFEEIELTGSKELVVRSADVAAITGGGSQLMVSGVSNDKVDLLGSWAEGTTQSVNGTIFRTFTSGGVTVLVEQGLTVAVGGSAPPGAIGLDAVASGGVAPVPVVDAGLDYTPNDLFLFDYELTQSVTVNPEEIWWNEGLEPVVTDDNSNDVTLTNYGTIFSFSEWAFPFTRTIEAHNLEHLVNHGTISAISTGSSGTLDQNFTEAVVAANHVVNSGLIEAQAAYGNAIALSFSSSGHTLVNSGDIYAYSDTGAAIGVTEVVSFTNHGSIIASGAKSAVGVHLMWDPYGNQVNDGYIEAATFGPNADRSIGISLVQVNMDNANATSFTNNGVIVADIALKFTIDTLSNGPYVISNNGELHGDVILGAISDKFTNSGLITGVTELGAGNDIFNGSSGVQGLVRGGVGNDTLTGGSQGDILDGGLGNDTLNGGAGFDAASYADATAGVTVSLAIAGAQSTVGAGTDTLSSIEDLSGSAFNDQLTGNSATNFLFGLAGNDLLKGGAGADSLTGGSGNDTFQDSKSGLNGDTITDFALGDKIIITDATLAGFTFNLAGNTLTYTGGSLTLQGLPAGQFVVSAAAGGGVELTLVVGPTEGNDTLTGTELADEISGLGGDDTVNGLGGDDRLHGNGGNDTLDGNAGSDVLYGDDGNDSLSGGADNDGLSGGNGDDALNGGAGDDGLMGGAGNDLLDGGSDGEYGDFANYTFGGGVTVNLAITGPQFISWSEGTDTLVNIENVTGSLLDDQLTGNAGANRLFGTEGWDVLNGAGGVDYLDGGHGLDTYIIASAAEHTAAEIDDTGTDAFDIHDMLFFTTTMAETLKLYAGDTGLEYVFISDAGGYTSGTVAANIDASLVANSLTITGNDGANILTGTAFNDTLNGNAGGDRLNGNSGDDWLDGGEGDDYLFGGVGNDTLIGGAGYDRMYGGVGDDTYRANDATDYAYENAGEGNDRVVSSLNSHTLRANIEELELTGAAVTGKGNELDNLIIGNELNNKLYGLTGSDTLDGMGGNDTLDGGTGADVMIGGWGNDQFYVDDLGDETIEFGDDGIDTVRTTIDHTLAANIENVVLLGTASLGATGNELNNVMTGNAGNNYFTGGAGVDQLKGLGGNDTLDGGVGSDRLYGGTGDDTYIVDTSGDLIFENAGEGIDTVISSGTYILAANVENLELTGIANVNGTGNGLGNQINGNAGANILYGGLGSDLLSGSDGTDVLKGEDGNDVLSGGAARDRFYGGAGADSFVFDDGDFAGLTSSTSDQIHDFSVADGDIIDLGNVDADASLAGDQAFAFIGSGAFTGTAGELRTYQSSGQTYVQGDTDGDGTADFMIRLDGLHTLGSGDFVM